MSDLMRMFKQMTSTDPVGDLKKEVEEATSEGEKQKLVDDYCATGVKIINSRAPMTRR